MQNYSAFITQFQTAIANTGLGNDAILSAIKNYDPNKPTTISVDMAGGTKLNAGISPLSADVINALNAQNLYIEISKTQEFSFDDIQNQFIFAAGNYLVDNTGGETFTIGVSK